MVLSGRMVMAVQRMTRRGGWVAVVRPRARNRSLRGIERACVEDVAYSVIATNLVPDHSSIAEFRKRHETALADLFSETFGPLLGRGLRLPPRRLAAGGRHIQPCPQRT